MWDFVTPSAIVVETMSRLESVFGALVLVSATILVTEWIHYRQGDTTLWSSVVEPGPGLSSAPGDGLPEPVTEGEFEHYVAVLEHMQSNRDATIDEATARESMSLEDFRHVEQRVQRSGILVERVRERLRQTAEQLWDSRLATLEQG